MVNDELLILDANTNLVESHSFAVLVKSRESKAKTQPPSP